jgi:hypothetical protein
LRAIRNPSIPCSTYYFRATSDAQCSAIVDSLSRNALIAREKAEKKSRLRKIQASILCAYESTPFQSFVALLIMAVQIFIFTEKGVTVWSVWG